MATAKSLLFERTNMKKVTSTIRITEAQAAFIFCNQTFQQRYINVRLTDEFVEEAKQVGKDRVAVKLVERFVAVTLIQL